MFPHPATGNHLDASKILKRFKRACERAGIQPVRFHDLRHTFGTHMAKVTSLRDIQEWMGHQDAKTTLRYAAFMPGADDAALVDEAFGRGTVSGTNLSDPRRPQETPDALG